MTRESLFPWYQITWLNISPILDMKFWFRNELSKLLPSRWKYTYKEPFKNLFKFVIITGWGEKMSYESLTLLQQVQEVVNGI